LAEIAENFISVSRVHAGKNKKTVGQNVKRFLRYSSIKN
jgi:hypothetical protein